MGLMAHVPFIYGLSTRRAQVIFQTDEDVDTRRVGLQLAA